MDKNANVMVAVFLGALTVIVAIALATVYSIRRVDMKQGVHMTDIQNSDRLPVVLEDGKKTEVRIVYDNVGSMGVWDREQINVRFAEPITEYYASQKDSSKLVSIAVSGTKDETSSQIPYRVKAVFADGKSESFDVTRQNGELSWAHFSCGYECPYPSGFVQKYPRVVRN